MTWQRETIFVDGALVELGDVSTFPDWLQRSLTREWPSEIAVPKRGMRVVKHGACTARTEGVLVDVACTDSPYIGDRAWLAPAQLLIDSVDRDLNFAGPGDSGAIVLDDENRLLGLLWGSNTGGQGIASPIGPVLDCLDVVPATRFPAAASRR